MSDDGKQFTIRRTFDAPREDVWRAWTDPLVAARWWHPDGMTTRPESVRMDLREGGTYAYTMVGPDGGEYPTTGTYLEVQHLERLRFTWGGPGDDSREAPVITVALADTQDGRTAMTFHVDGVDGRPGDDDVYDGWASAFDILDGQVLSTNRGPGAA